MTNEDDTNEIESQIDLNQLANQPRWKAELKTENPLEQQNRLDIEKWDAWFRRGERAVGVVALLIGIGSIVWLCYGISSDPKSSADDKKWSTSILASIVSLGAGYLAPRPK